MQVETIAECSMRAFCNSFDLHHKLPFVFKTFVLSIFEWPLKTGFTLNIKKPGPEVIKLFSYLTQLSTKLILIVGILTFISMTNTTSE